MQTIGERLEEARKRKGISIREAAEATKIRGDYLQKFENNQFDIGLSDLYTRGFLRTYSQLLKLPAERIVNDFRTLSAIAENKPKTPSREVYGRMDISYASSGGKAPKENGDPADLNDDEAGGEGGKRTFARIGTSLPTGTFIDQRIVLKVGIGVLVVIVLGLVIWGIRSVSGGSSSPTNNPNGSQVIAANEQTIVLIALDNVDVKVVQEADGVQLFQGPLVRGERRNIVKRGAVFVTARDGRNLLIEIQGKRYPLPFQGYDRCKVE